MVEGSRAIVVVSVVVSVVAVVIGVVRGPMNTLAVTIYKPSKVNKKRLKLSL